MNRALALHATDKVGHMIPYIWFPILILESGVIFLNITSVIQ